MVSVTHPPHDIEVTAERLQEGSARLQIQKQALERELAAIVAQSRLGATGSQHLRVLDACHGCRGAQAQIPKPVVPQTEIVSNESAKSANIATTPAPRAQKPPSRSDDADRPAPAGDDTDGQKTYGQLTEQIMEYFAAADDADVRALDMAAALGRDSDSGSINGVRNTLERRESATNEGFGSAESAKATHR
ncbi:hypothetical protein ABT086_00905 [Streptomyces mirabilis]